MHILYRQLDYILISLQGIRARRKLSKDSLVISVSLHPKAVKLTEKPYKTRYRTLDAEAACRQRMAILTLN